MSNGLRSGAVARIASSEARQRSLTMTDRSEEYMPNSTALAAEAQVVQSPPSDRRTNQVLVDAAATQAFGPPACHMAHRFGLDDRGRDRRDRDVFLTVADA